MLLLKDPAKRSEPYDHPAGLNAGASGCVDPVTIEDRCRLELSGFAVFPEPQKLLPGTDDLSSHTWAFRWSQSGPA
jgi:hypothetical protein